MPSPTNPQPANPTDPGWTTPSIAAKYAQAEGATRPYARLMLDKAKLDSHSGELRVFDLGCGTGAVEAELYARLPAPSWARVQVVAGDVSEPMLAYLKKRGREEGWVGLETRVVDGENIPLTETETYTHVFVNFAIFLLPPSTLRTCSSLLAPRGFLGITTWASLPWYPLFARAVERLQNPPPLPSHHQLQDHVYRNQPWGEPAFVAQQLRAAGCKDVEVVTEEREMDCGSPSVWMETMEMALRMASGVWEEGGREGVVARVRASLGEVAEEEVRAKGGRVWLRFVGVVGVGWKG